MECRFSFLLLKHLFSQRTSSLTDLKTLHWCICQAGQKINDYLVLQFQFPLIFLCCVITVYLHEQVRQIIPSGVRKENLVQLVLQGDLD